MTEKLKTYRNVKLRIQAPSKEAAMSVVELIARYPHPKTVRVSPARSGGVLLYADVGEISFYANRLPYGADSFEDLGDLICCGRQSYQDEANTYLGRALAVMYNRMDENAKDALTRLLFAHLGPTKEIEDLEHLRECLDMTVENAINGILPSEEDEDEDDH